MKVLHMKFSWHILSKENLWTKFFKAKYMKGAHLISTAKKPMGSRYWKALYKMAPEVHGHCYTLIRASNVSFQFNNCLGNEPLVGSRPKLIQPKLTIRDMSESSGWNTGMLSSLVGEDRTLEIVTSNVVRRQDLD